MSISILNIRVNSMHQFSFLYYLPFYHVFTIKKNIMDYRPFRIFKIIFFPREWRIIIIISIVLNIFIIDIILGIFRSNLWTDIGS